MIEPRPLHRIFALSWIDFFDGTSVEVETEKDLSLKQQFVDVVLIRKGAEEIPRELPDGLEGLAAHNLLTFKSYQESLDAWALYELVGHYVNYRKQSSQSMQSLDPEEDYKLFAICARFPNNLAQQGVLRAIQDGVYEIQWLTLRIRIIVIHQLPLEERNAMLLVFSAREESLRYGREHHKQYSSETSTVLNELFRFYIEDPTMNEKLKEFARESRQKLLKSLSLEERLEGLSAEELLKRFPTEELLKGLPAEERLKGLPAEERLKGLSPEEVVRAIPPEVLKALAQKLKENGSSTTQ